MVEDGNFRAELLFRLGAFTIELPSLRERREDIKALAMHHAARLCERYQIGTKGFSPDFFEALTAYDWPGNVRELVHAIEHAITDAYHEPTLFPKHLPLDIRVKVARSAVKSAPPPNTTPSPLQPLTMYRQATERQYLQELMVQCGGNMKEALRLSGLSRSRLYALLKEYEISAG